MAEKYYIDANALMEEAKRLAGPETGDGWSNMGLYALIERQPAADVRPVKRGHWIETAPINERTLEPFIVKGPHFKCSNCGAIDYRSDFCPNCGADMGRSKDG